MPVKYFAAIDTSILVFVVLKQKSAPSNVIELAFDGLIVPVLNGGIEIRYRKVLLRPKFHLTEDIMNDVIGTFHQYSLYTDNEAVNIDLPDPKDRAFYEAVIEKRKNEDAYFATGNIRHFSTIPFIVTPRQMPDVILKDQEG